MSNNDAITIRVSGNFKNVPEPEIAVFRTRINRAGDCLEKNTGCPVEVILNETPNSSNQPSPSNNGKSENGNDENNIHKLAQQYQSQKPIYSFETLKLPDRVADDLTYAVDSIKVQDVVFREWGLDQIQPNPSTILNEHGPSGTGKTLSAHAIAHRLGKLILLASYADIDSKYHGEGPKHLKAIFYAAERDGAVLFIDEADSLLSKRLTDVNTGSEQAINSMRSQLFICLEQFNGIVIFATNLVENYDKAFHTRVRHIKFSLPDEKCRREIWRCHLPSKLPLADDVSIDLLAKIEDLSGREIREIVIDVANRAALNAKRQFQDPRKAIITLKDLQEAAERKKAERPIPDKEKLTLEEQEEVNQKIRATFSSENS